MNEASRRAGHAFISYARENARRVDVLQRKLRDAGIPVWRDTVDLWPGQDWRAQIRIAINGEAFVFIACFSRASVSRARSYQNEELALAIDEFRRRNVEEPWLIPVRFDDCKIPDHEIGYGRTLNHIQRADLFGAKANEGMARLIAVVQRILSRRAEYTFEGARNMDRAPGFDMELAHPPSPRRRITDAHWKRFTDEYALNEVIYGEVVKLVNYGAFVLIEPGIQGLVHISELSDKYISSPEDVIKVGGHAYVEIISIDSDRRRIGLSRITDRVKEYDDDMYGPDDNLDPYDLEILIARQARKYQGN